MESNTKFGLALIVLLCGTLAFVVYKKMERRRAEQDAVAAAAQAESETAPDGDSRAERPSPFDRPKSAVSTRHRHRGEETDETELAGDPPVQSEPPLHEQPESRSSAYRGIADASSGGRGSRSRREYAQHPLRRLESESHASTAEPNPFPARQSTSAAGADSASTPTTNPFASSAETAVEAGESQQAATTDAAAQPIDAAIAGGSASVATADASGAETPTTADGGGSPFDQTTEATTAAAATETDADVVEAPWSAASGTQIQPAATNSIQSEPSATTAVPVSHNAAWDRPTTAERTGVGNGAESPPFSPVQATYNARPQSTAPAPAATPAESSPWDAAPTRGSGSATSNPFAATVQQTSVATTRDSEQRQLQDDLSAFGAGQSFVADADRPAVYTVRSGDTYWGISRNQYGTGKYYRALALYNSHRIPDPRRMQKGMQVLVPDREILESRCASVLPKRTGGTADRLPSGLFHANGEVVYRVGRGDTLGNIAQRHLGRASRWQEIVRLNPGRLTNPAALKIGMELRLPADASRVRIVSEVTERR